MKNAHLDIWGRPEGGRALGTAGRLRVEQAHSWRATAERMAEAYARARAGRG